MKKDDPKPSKPKIRRASEIEKTLAAEQAKSKDYLNRLMYLQADFENYRKRVEKEIGEAIQRTNERLITDLIAVIDELEIAVQSSKKTENKQALIEGVEMVLKKLYATLEQEGLAKIEAVGKPFDPNKHEVILRVPTNNHVEGTVIEEVRRGYMFKNKVIRPSIVKVALASAMQGQSESQGECEK